MRRSKRVIMYGVVTNYLDSKGYGFIRDLKTNNEYFLYKNNLNGEYIKRGCYVHFAKFKDKRRDNNAKILHIIEYPED